jgi:hypothetical protein
MVKCRVIARNLFLKPDDKHSNRLRECEIGEELSYKEGAMPPAWTGKVEVIDGKRKPNAADEQAALIEKLTAELDEKTEANEKLTAELDELTKPVSAKKLENATPK